MVLVIYKHLTSANQRRGCGCSQLATLVLVLIGSAWLSLYESSSSVPEFLAEKADHTTAVALWGCAFDAGTFAACPETGQIFCCSLPGAPAVAAACNQTIPAGSCRSNVDLINCACPLETTFVDFAPFLTNESWQNVPYDPHYVDGGAPTCTSTGRYGFLPH